jgi:outer membrane protein assembly factor BamB
MITPWIVFTAVSVFGAGAVGADAWPELRGPTGQGHSTATDLPREWGPDQNVAWRQTIPGRGWSSPVVADGRVYLTTAVPGDGGRQSLRALALDAATGKVLWDREVFAQGESAPPIHAKNSHASPTPLIYDGRLYVHFGHQGTACLDRDGQVLWRNRDHRYAPVHGNGGSPILVDDLLIFSCDGDDRRFVAALDRDTGRQRWKADRPGNPVKGFSFHTPLLITVQGQKQVVSAGSDAVCAYDPATGKEVWKVRYSGYSVIPRPVFGHGLVYVCTGYDAPSLLAVRPDGAGDVTATHVAWRVRKGVPHTPSPLLVGDELYLVSDAGTATCLDARTGREHWQRRLGAAFSASPLDAGGRIYFQSEEGVGVVLKAGRRFEQLARNDLGERALASYAAIGGALFIRTEKHLYRIQAEGRPQR